MAWNPMIASEHGPTTFIKTEQKLGGIEHGYAITPVTGVYLKSLI